MTGHEPQRKSAGSTILETVLPALVIVVFVRVFLVGLYRVPSASMADTIQVGDCVLGERVTYRTRSPEPGEIVTFESPDEPGVTLVKRVIATEDQAIDIRDGNVFVDGEKRNDPYVRNGSSYPTEQDEDNASGINYPHVIAKGCVWVMGDNRANSRDSRIFGDVPVSSITSRVVCAYWPPERAHTMT